MKRRLLKLAGLLLLGAIINVAVVWGISATIPKRLISYTGMFLATGPPPLHWRASTQKAFGSLFINARAWRDEVPSPIPNVPSWSAIRAPPTRWDEEVNEAAYGWPRLTLRVKDDSRLFPTEMHPVFPGFAINTLFYAGVLWVLFCGPFALRRMIRRRRGRCPQCAYPIGQSPVCTECGATIHRVQ